MTREQLLRRIAAALADDEDVVELTWSQKLGDADEGADSMIVLTRAGGLFLVGVEPVTYEGGGGPETPGARAERMRLEREEPS